MAQSRLTTPGNWMSSYNIRNVYADLMEQVYFEDLWDDLWNQKTTISTELAKKAKDKERRNLLDN